MVKQCLLTAALISKEKIQPYNIGIVTQVEGWEWKCSLQIIMDK